MSLLETVRWALREGGNRILEVLKTERMEPPAEEQPRPERRGSTDAPARWRGVSLVGLRRRFLERAGYREVCVDGSFYRLFLGK